MKKLFTLLCLFLLTANAAWALTATFNLGVKKGISVPEGYFKSVGEKFNWNNKFNGGEYDGISFSQGLKMEADTKIGFTTSGVSVVTIVQSTFNDATIKFDNEELPVESAEAGTGCRIYTLKNVPVGDHVIGRGSGESGLFYVKVEEANTVTFVNDAGWDNVYVWAWNDYENFTGGFWPGEKLTANGEGNYVWSTQGEPTKILFSDGGGNQTADLDFVNGGVYKSTGRVIELNSWSATFKTNVWNQVWAYVWDEKGVEPMGAWPGTQLTLNGDAYEMVCEAENAPQYIIFHNNAGEQTPDWTFQDGKAYEYMKTEYTATFTTDADWENVYAYVWSGEGDDAKKFTGEWPGVPLIAIDGVYTVTIEAFEAPEKILFNGDSKGQTPDMAFTDGRTYKWNTTLNPLFTLEASDTPIPAGTTVVVKDAYDDAVATLTYGEKGDGDFYGPVFKPNEEYAGFQNYTAGNGENGSSESGTFYVIKPFFDGTITVGVLLRAGKAFYITEDDSPLTGFDGMKMDYDSCTAFEFPVKAGSTYKLFCTFSKLGFYGFDYKFEKQINTYTATFKTNLVWESVYAYAWSGDGDTAVKFLGDWPGIKVTDVDDSNDDYDIYTLTFEASKAPEKIIFSNGVGGKVGRTQTADLEFVDGKEYSLIYVPSDLMQYAIQLADSADEGEALNKLLEAIQYAFENDDESQLQAAIDQFIADTEKANYFIDFAAGSYYIIDAETGMMMAAGGSFGTHGIVNDLGLDLWLTPYTESRTVTIDSRVSGGGNSHFLSQNLFMDSEEWGWGLVYQGFGFYIKDTNSGKYINIDEDNNLVLSDTPREWIIVSAEGVRTERMEELAEATIDNPKDATFLITAPNFNRNDQRNAEAWNVSGDCTLSTGNEVNNCAESLHSTFTISQTLAGAPKGTYQLTAQGFYRQDDGASEAAPQFFIGSEMVQLPKLTGSEANASDASASFTNGLYTIDPITFYYDGTGDLTIGIQGTAEHQWVVFDNFCLTYLSSEKYEVYTEFVEATGTLTYYYDAKMPSRSGVTEVYDPVGNPDAVRFTGYYKKVLKAVIDPSMKDAPLTSMRNMFYGGFHPETFVMQSLSNMTSIEGLENLNTSTVTDMNNMFGLCQSLTTLDLSSFNTSKVTTFNGMFQGCENLKMADVSSFDINKVKDMGMMFMACTKLTTICCDKDWSNSTAESGYMFSGCKKLVGGKGTPFDSNVINATYARPDGGTASPGYFTADTMTGISLTEEGRSQMEDGAIYNLAGQRLSKTQRGINIVGGKKIIIN